MFLCKLLLFSIFTSYCHVGFMTCVVQNLALTYIYGGAILDKFAINSEFEFIFGFICSTPLTAVKLTCQVLNLTVSPNTSGFCVL